MTISAEKKEERTEKKENFYLSERQYGSVRRSFRLPDGVDDDKVSATFDNGVLTVRLPKSEPAKRAAKKIEIGRGGNAA